MFPEIEKPINTGFTGYKMVEAAGVEPEFPLYFLIISAG